MSACTDIEIATTGSSPSEGIPERVLYGQCWEDAEVLLAGLDIQPGDTCLSIASAGDNTLALLTANPRRVVAIDVSAAQLACLDLRAAAFRILTYAEILELLGVRPSVQRVALYRACRHRLRPESIAFWNDRPALLDRGLIKTGRLERYLRFFSRVILPLIHDRHKRELLLTPMSHAERAAFFDTEWNTARWRLLVRIFFSQLVMARFGRQASFFRYAQDSVADQVVANVRHALVDLDPSQNPYLRYILTGQFGPVLPLSLREEHAEAIFRNLDALELRHVSIEDHLAGTPPGSIHRFNLSDIFEYVSGPRFIATLQRIVEAARPGARLMYWNLLVPRKRPRELSNTIEHLAEISRSLHERDQTFFYRNVVVEEVTGNKS